MCIRVSSRGVDYGEFTVYLLFCIIWENLFSNFDNQGKFIVKNIK